MEKTVIQMEALLGKTIPNLEIPTVDEQRMKTMAALLRDPYPVHWDKDANKVLGIGEKVINQGPLNLSYIVNMLIHWQGPTCIRRLKAKFLKPVFGGDNVVAGGKVIEIINSSSSRVLCEIWLKRGNETVLSGEAEVTITNQE